MVESVGQAEAAVDDVPILLDRAAQIIDDLEGQLHVANAQLEVMQFVRTLVGMRGGTMGPVGMDKAERWTDQLRQRAKTIRRVGGQSR